MELTLYRESRHTLPQLMCALAGSLHGLDELRLDAALLHGCQRRVGRAALGGYAGAQHVGRLCRLLRQRRGADKRAYRQLMRLRRAQSHLGAGLDHGFNEVKNIGRA